MVNDAKDVVKLLNEVVIKPSDILKNKEVEINYLKEKTEIFYTEAIKETYLKLTGNSKENLRMSVFLGAKLKTAKDNFLLPENKQDRKNLGLKMSVKHFIEQNFSLSETYVNRLIKASESSDKLEQYLETGHIGKIISVDNFISWLKPKKDETAETETAPETETAETETAPEINESEQSSFGGITLTSGFICA